MSTCKRRAGQSNVRHLDAGTYNRVPNCSNHIIDFGNQVHTAADVSIGRWNVWKIY